MTQEKSDHFDGRRFVNPAGAAGHPFSAVARMLLEPRTRWPARIHDPTPSEADNVLALTAGVLAFDLVVKGVLLRKTSAWKRFFEPLPFWRWFGLN